MVMSRTTANTKQKLIDTALELIWINSYGTVSVEEICKTAGIGKGSFYYFFSTKADLAVAAMEEDNRRLKNAHNDVFSASRPPLERIERFADLIYDSQAAAAVKYGHVCGCPCASLGSEMAGQDCGIGKKFKEISDERERYLATTLRDLIADGLLPKSTDVKSKAQELYAYVAGQVSLARIHNNLESIKKNLKKGLLQLVGVKEEATHGV
jgi:TetR/AcrR family transcriptional regulator, transcriptional repressor for nem operon